MLKDYIELLCLKIRPLISRMALNHRRTYIKLRRMSHESDKDFGFLRFLFQFSLQYFNAKELYKEFSEHKTSITITSHGMSLHILHMFRFMLACRRRSLTVHSFPPSLARSLSFYFSFFFIRKLNLPQFNFLFSSTLSVFYRLLYKHVRLCLCGAREWQKSKKLQRKYSFRKS